VDLNQAIQFGLLVKAAEAMLPANIASATGQMVPATYDPNNVGYKVVGTILGNDLATTMNPGRGNRIVSFGFILQAPNNDAVIAIRGTEGIREWIHNFEFLATKCPFLAGAGKTDDGFTAIYNSLRVATTSARLVDAVAALPFDHAINSLTICGHSLGGALATLLALDVAANTSTPTPARAQETRYLRTPTTRLPRIPIASRIASILFPSYPCHHSTNMWRDSTS